MDYCGCPLSVPVSYSLSTTVTSTRMQGLDLERDFFTRRHAQDNDSLRLLHYFALDDKQLEQNRSTLDARACATRAALPAPVMNFVHLHKQRRMHIKYKHLVHKHIRTCRLRCKEHSDYGSITLLLRDSCAGLQVCMQRVHMYSRFDCTQYYPNMLPTCLRMIVQSYVLLRGIPLFVRTQFYALFSFNRSIVNAHLICLIQVRGSVSI
jgi:hypothetical protein